MNYVLFFLSATCFIAAAVLAIAGVSSDSDSQPILAISALIICGAGLAAIPLWAAYQSERRTSQSLRGEIKQQKFDSNQNQRVLSSMLEDLHEERVKSKINAERNEKLAAVMAQSSDCLFLLDKDGQVEDVNQASCLMLKLKEDEIRGHDFSDLFPDHKSEISNVLDQVRNKSQLMHFEFTPQTSNKRINLQVTPIQSQQTPHIAVFGRDLTEKRIQEERFKLAVEAAPNAMIMINQNGIIVLHNSKAEQLFGYASHELNGLSIETLVPDKLVNLHREYRQEYMDGPEPREMGSGRDLFAKHKTGKMVPVEIGLTPIESGGETYIISAILDISERKKAQSQLESLNRTLRKQNMEMEQFIYAVSHDLRAPLVTIGGFTTRLKASLLPHLDEQQVHRFDRILANVTNMENLLEDLLKLSRVIQKSEDLSWLKTEECIEEVVQSLSEMIERSHAKIQYQDLTPIFFNKQLLKQILQNLITNGIKYKHPDRDALIQISTQKTDQTIILRVGDNGIGIPENCHEKIFKVFERLAGPEIEGTGVGLSIVKSIIQKYDGHIELDSEVGIGSTFSLHFPNGVEYGKT